LLGDWEAAEQELTHGADADGLADDAQLVVNQGWLAVLRGDAATAEIMLTKAADVRVSENPRTSR
jgi:hypothetical protein